MSLLAACALFTLVAGLLHCTTAFDPALLDRDGAVAPSPTVNATGRGIRCGDSTCPLGPETGCCFDPTTATHECGARAVCTKTWFACSDTKHCAALGKPTFTCCADTVMVDAGVYLALEAKCVAPAACNAGGLQDQLCDPEDPSECTQANDGRTACKHYPWTGRTTYDFCTAP